MEDLNLRNQNYCIGVSPDALPSKEMPNKNESSPYNFIFFCICLIGCFIGMNSPFSKVRRLEREEAESNCLGCLYFYRTVITSYEKTKDYLCEKSRLSEADVCKLLSEVEQIEDLDQIYKLKISC